MGPLPLTRSGPTGGPAPSSTTGTDAWLGCSESVAISKLDSPLDALGRLRPSLIASREELLPSAHYLADHPLHVAGYRVVDSAGKLGIDQVHGRSWPLAGR